MRLKWVDSVKGLAIILMVLGHTMYVPCWLKQYIHSFHMPLFFFISGYLFSREKYVNSFKGFLDSRVSSLIKPYVAYNLLSFFLSGFLLYAALFIGLDIAFITWPDDWLVPLYSFLMGNGGFVAPLWFLPCLFLTEMLYYWLSRKIKNKLLLMAAICLLAVARVLYPAEVTALLPGYLQTALMALAYYGAGQYLRLNEESFNRHLWVLLIMSCEFHLLLFSRMKYDISIINGDVLAVLCALCGIIFYICLFKRTDKAGISSRTLCFFGRNSLAVLGLHMIAICLVGKLDASGLFYTKEVSLICVLVLVYLFVLIKPQAGRWTEQKLLLIIRQITARVERKFIYGAIAIYSILLCGFFYVAIGAEELEEAHIWPYSGACLSMNWSFDDSLGNYYWMGEDRTMALLSRKNVTVDATLNLRRINGTGEISIFLNNYSVGSYLLSKEPLIVSLNNVRLKEGWNIIELVPDGECTPFNDDCFTVGLGTSDPTINPKGLF